MRLTTIPCIKRLSLRRKRFERRRRLYAHKTAWQMDGGPLHQVWLCCPGTLRFSIPGWTGYYDGDNKWVDQ